MATEALISWNAPQHFHVEKKQDWYWAVGIITLALAGVAIIVGNVITGIFILVASIALVIHASHPPKNVYHEINDRGIMVDEKFHSFLSLESFWIPHDDFPPKIILKSRTFFSPLIVIFIDEVDPEEIREVLLEYIAETEHRQHFLHKVLEQLGF